MDVLHLYGFGDNDRSGKVRFTAAELGIPVEEHRVGFPDHRKEPYLSRNPFGAVPSITYRGRTMSESTAICQWLAEEHGALTIAPGDPRRADYLWWISASTESCEGRLVDAAVSAIGLVPKEVFDQQAPMVKRRIRALVAHLPDEGFVCGDDFTVADICVAYSVRLGLATGLLDADAVGSWYERVKARPAAAKARFFPG